MRKVPTTENTADALTKLLDHPTSEKHANNVMAYADEVISSTASRKRSADDSNATDS